MRSALLDAGPLVVLFAVDDKHHARFDDLIAALAADGLRQLTTYASIVEAGRVARAGDAGRDA